MIRGYKFILFFAMLAEACSVFSQKRNIDSLFRTLQAGGEDTNRVNALNMIGWELKNADLDSAIALSDEAFLLSEKLKWEKGKAHALSNLGVYHYFKGNYPRALDYHQRALEIDKALNNEKGVATRLGNIGLVYKEQSNYTMALKYYFSALEIDEKLGNKDGVARHQANIGLVHTDQGDYDKALHYYRMALATNEALKNKSAMARTLSNIGTVYSKLGDHNLALENYFKALKIDEELQNKMGMAILLGNIGNVYGEQKDYDNALNYCFRALKMTEELGDKRGNARNLGNIGIFFLAQKNYGQAEKYFLRALHIDIEIGTLSGRMHREEQLAELYSQTNRDNLALEHFKKFIQLKDSINNEENTRKQTRLEMQYEFDKEAAADSIRNVEMAKQEQMKHEQELRQQQTYTYGGIAGFILMLAVAGVSFRAYRQKQQANAVISRQKLMVEEKQREILDSIHYARRIQKSLLPTSRYIMRYLKPIEK